MKARISAFAAILAVSFLASCSSGDGDNSGTVTPVDTYPLHAAWVSYATEAGTKPFTLSGMSVYISPGVEFTGSGTAIYGQLVSATFESQSALMKAITATGTIVIPTGGTVGYDASSTLYFDSNYRPLGAVSDGAYSVVSSTATIPQTAKIGDTGPIYSATTYSDGSKTTVISNSTATYELVADTASSALLKVTETEFHPDGWEVSTYIATFQLMPDGQLTRLTEQISDWVSWLEITY